MDAKYNVEGDGGEHFYQNLAWLLLVGRLLDALSCSFEANVTLMVLLEFDMFDTINYARG